MSQQVTVHLRQKQTIITDFSSGWSRKNRAIAHSSCGCAAAGGASWGVHGSGEGTTGRMSHGLGSGEVLAASQSGHGHFGQLIPS